MIRAARFIPASDAEAERGFLAYVKVDYGLLVLDGITLRRHADGRLGLSWPERTDRAGRRHPVIRPLSEDARLAIEQAVLVELARQERPRRSDARGAGGAEEGQR